MEKEVNTGKSFEQEVADAFTLLGYKVEMDVQIAGKQVDMIVALKTPGFSDELLFYVECKDYNHSNLQSEDIDKFQSAYDRAKRELHFTGGILVTRKPLHSKVKQSLNHPDLKTQTLFELKDQSMSINLILREYITTHNESGISKTYIPLKYNSRKNRSDLLTFAYEWLENDEPLLVLLGDFGTGKSTFLKHLKYELAKYYIEQRKNLVPLYIPLKNFESYSNTETFYENQLNLEFEKNIRLDEFYRISEKNDFLLLLDGFDEMGLHIDSNTRKHHFRELVNIVNKSQKAILTCRPSYFLSKDEMENVLDQIKSPVDFENPRINRHLRKEYGGFSNSVFSALTGEKVRSKNKYYTTVNLSEFNEKDIDDYLDKFFQDETVEFRKDIRVRIRNTYDLEDLAKRPILLYLIANSLPQLSEDKEATPALIYEVYTNAWLTREENKGEFRKLITIEKKFSFVCHLAWKMYEDNILEVSYRELPQIVQNYFLVEGKTHSSFVTHIQSCAFLNRDESDVFRFEHKSFMEYFSALFLSEEIQNKQDFTNLEVKLLSKELSFFLGDMCYGRPTLLKLIEEKFISSIKSSSPASETLKTNLLLTFSKSRKSFPRTKVYGLRFLELEFLKNSFYSDMENCTFEKTNFKSCSFKDMELSNLTSIETKIKNKSLMRNVKISFSGENNQIIVEQSKIKESTLNGKAHFNLTNSTLSDSKVDGAFNITLLESEFSMNSFNSSELNGSISNCNFSKDTFYNPLFGSIGAKPSKNRKISVRSSKFSNCTFVLLDFHNFDFEKCTFEKCTFLGCSFTYYSGNIFTDGMSFSKCNFIFSTISSSSWFMEENNKLKVLQSEYEENLSDLMNLMLKEKSNSNGKNEGEYTVAYNKLSANPPKLPPVPKVASDNFIKLLKDYLSKDIKGSLSTINQSSLPFEDNPRHDIKWHEYGQNLLGVFRRYLKA